MHVLTLKTLESLLKMNQHHPPKVQLASVERALEHHLMLLEEKGKPELGTYLVKALKVLREQPEAVLQLTQ